MDHSVRNTYTKIYQVGEKKKEHKIKNGSRLGNHFFPHKAILLQERIGAIPSVVVRARVTTGQDGAEVQVLGPREAGTGG